METQFNWLQSVRNDSLPSGHPNLGHPPVSFEINSMNSAANANHASPSATPPEVPEPRSKYSDTQIDRYAHQDEQDSIPLSLTAKDLTLQESKTYMRWYSDILARTNQRTISIADVYQFLGNFKISEAIKNAINRIFFKISRLINIGEFFALLRVISHALQGQSPSRALIKIQTAVPLPPSILWKKRQKDDNDSDDEIAQDTALQQQSNNNNPLDLDLFTQFMLTGERPGDKASKKRLKKLKTVKFSDEVETSYRDDFLTTTSPPSQDLNTMDYSLSMDQLMSRMNASKSSSHLTVPDDNRRAVHSPDPEEKQILQDMALQINHFQNLHSVDTILVDGVPSNIHVQPNSDFRLPHNMLPQPQLLKPNMTGPAQMAQMGLYNGVRLVDADYKYTDPTLEGAQRMARLFSPTSSEAPKVSLESFTSQMTGNQPFNTDNDSQGFQTQDSEPATVTRMRAMSQPSPMHLPSPWENSNGESASARPHAFSLFLTGARSASLSPAPPIPPRATSNSNGRPAPPPPRARKSSVATPNFGTYSAEHEQVPPPLPQKVPNDTFYQNTQNNSTANMLDDLKALQEEVDKIRDLTGGF